MFLILLCIVDPGSFFGFLFAGIFFVTRDQSKDPLKMRVPCCIISAEQNNRRTADPLPRERIGLSAPETGGKSDG